MLTLLFPQPAALIKTAKTKTLVIADPHIGWETALQEKGINVPSQTPKIIQKLRTLVAEHQPDSLLILGDVKYTVLATEPSEWHEIPDFFQKIHDNVKEISIVRGNHDANLEAMLPEFVKILPATGTSINDVSLIHGHKWPSIAMLRCKTLLMGHVHPVVVFRDPTGFKTARQVWVKAQINTEKLAKTLLLKHKIKLVGTPDETIRNQLKFKSNTTQVFIAPSFNDFLGGRAMNEVKTGKDGKDQMIGPLWRSGILDIDNVEVYLLDGTYLGTLSQIRNMQYSKKAA